MKEFRHACQPYGTIILKDATRQEVEVKRYIPNVGFRGTRKTMRVTGTVVSARFYALLCGVRVGDGVDRYKPGETYSVDDVSDYEWEHGYKVSVAM